jgi:hypothetical protein
MWVSEWRAIRTAVNTQLTRVAFVNNKFELPFSVSARQWRVFKVVGKSAVISNVPFFRVPFFQKFTILRCMLKKRGVDWIQVAQGRVQWRVLVYTIMKIWFSQEAGNVLISLATSRFQSRSLLCVGFLWLSDMKSDFSWEVPGSDLDPGMLMVSWLFWISPDLQLGEPTLFSATLPLYLLKRHSIVWMYK